MSIDLSDPSVVSVREAFTSASSPLTWFLLQYNSPTNPSALVVNSSGPDPVLPHLRGTIQTSPADVLFGYAEIAGKGLVLVYLTDKVGGVRRADNEVSHKQLGRSSIPAPFRSFSPYVFLPPEHLVIPLRTATRVEAPETSLSLGDLQDYTALITIADPSQLTDELVRDKLGLNDDQVQASNYPSLQDDGTSSRSDWRERFARDRPAAPAVHSLPPGAGEPHHQSNRSTSSHPSPPPPQDPKMIVGIPIFPALSPTVTPQAMNPIPLVPAASSRHSGHSARSSSSVIEPDRPLDPRGISSADYFKDERSPKTSLSSRFEKAVPFRSPSGPRSPPTPSLPGPTQPPPSSGRFRASSFAQAFTKRRSSQDLSISSTGSISTVPNSPPIGELGEDSSAPPRVPPKDRLERLNNREPVGDPASGRSEPPSAYHTPSSSNANQPTPLPAITNRDAAPISNGHVRPIISPSPSAREALSTVSQRTAAQENAIQERFRRSRFASDERQGNREAVVMDEDDDVRLTYDELEPDEGRTAEGWPGGGLGRAISASTLVTSGMPTPRVERVMEFPEDGRAGHRLPQEGVGELQVGENGQRLEREGAEMEGERERGVADRGQNGGDLERLHGERLEVERAQREQAEAERLEDDQVGVESLNAEDAERARAETAPVESERNERERLEVEQAEQDRAWEQRLEGERRENEKAERAQLDAKRAERQRAERERSELEQAEAKRVEAERVQREQRRRAEEAGREQQRRAEEAEREQQHRAEEVESRRRAEESRRQRKESIRTDLAKGKTQGGVMLSGWVTVQTTKSTLWRRRWFRLHPGEMRLFKAEADAKPIQVISLGRGTNVSQTYEESQVQGSFKVVSDGPSGQEEFFLFTDSAEEKDTIAEGLALAKVS